MHSNMNVNVMPLTPPPEYGRYSNDESQEKMYVYAFVRPEIRFLRFHVSVTLWLTMSQLASKCASVATHRHSANQYAIVFE